MNAPVVKPGTDADRKARAAVLFAPITAFLEAAIAADAEEGRAPSIGRSHDWPAVMAAIERDDRAARRRAAANRRETEPAAAWKARTCPMVGGPCITVDCVCWMGNDTAGFCAQIVAMRRQIEAERSAPCS